MESRGEQKPIGGEREIEELKQELAELGEDKRPQRYRAVTEDIDEVFDRIYQSNQQAAANLETIKKNGITHILRVTQAATPQHEGIKYLVFDKVWDDSEQNIIPQMTEGNEFIK